MKEFTRRLEARNDELKWLYMELYKGQTESYDRLCLQMLEFYDARSEALKASDRVREAKPDWYLENDLIGMMMYTDNFAGNLQGVRKHLDYLEKSH